MHFKVDCPYALLFECIGSHARLFKETHDTLHIMYKDVFD
jgi:hypothetical protein